MTASSLRNEITRREAMSDVAVVLGCATVYVVAGNAGIGGRWLIAAVGLLLMTYAVLVLARRGERFRDFGLRGDNLRAAAKSVGAWTVPAAVAIIGFALLRGESLFRPELLVMLPLYPMWGVVQQSIFQGVLHRRLLSLVESRRLAVLLTATAFALVHLGSWPLVGLTFVAGLMWSWLFQRYPNVWMLGVSHGVLAALAYPLVLADDPLSRM